MDDRLDYLHAHEDAVVAKQGLWVNPNPIPPWEFRREKRTKINLGISEIPVANAKPSVKTSVNVKKSAVAQGNSSDKKTIHCLNMPTDADILDCLN